jgi:hypothetical protein
LPEEGKIVTEKPPERLLDVDRRKRPADAFLAYSFLLFCALALAAIVLFPEYYPFFVALVMVDGLATLMKSEFVVCVDRSLLFITLIVASVAIGSYGLFFIFLEVLLMIAALDVSFLLRRLQGSVVDLSVVKARLRSYLFTLVPAFLLSYSLTYLYSSISVSSSQEALVLLAVSCPAALLSVYGLLRFLSNSTPERR